MAGEGFVHLHNHTEYSMLDGLANVKALFAEAANQGMSALAITDHGNLFGAYEFYKAGKAAGVKPIIGLEGYYLPVGSRFDRGPFQFDAAAGGNLEDGGNHPGKLNYTHMTLWAENNTGLSNLFRISSLASLEGQFGKWPRIDRELLDNYGKGLIATTGCPSGEVQRWLQAGNYERARSAAADYRDIFGRESFFVEVMDHNIGIERQVRDDLLRLAADLAIPLLATNDLHYVKASDAHAHDALLCIQTGKNLSDPNRFRFDAQDFYLKTAGEMRGIWKDYPEACDNTLLVAERCDVSFQEGRDLLPRFPVPAGMDENGLLAVQVKQGLADRFAILGGSVPADYLQRADYELSVIKQMGFPGYFLVVADLVRYAKENGIRVGPGRGSAAGALIAWALGITELDPIKHGLLFERFLNPERVSMPDIDMDFDDRRRGDMIRYATERYGEERVAQIITYSTIKAKAAIKDSARIMGLPFALGDEITKAMPPAVMGKDIPLHGIFDSAHPRYREAAEFRKLYEDRSDVREVVDTARGLEGARRQTGVHAAGVILSAEPLIDVIPVMRRPDGTVITQFDMGACEKLGLLKMDFLGLRNLSILDDCLDHIRRNRGEEVVLERLSLDDPATYELLSRGDTLGVFQLDGTGLRQLLRSIVPTSFDDISAVLALYRPGPMGENAHNDYADRKNNRKPIEPIHPELAEALEPILGETFGVIVYQEQVMAVAQQLAGYSLGQADLLRRAMGKKDHAALAKEIVRFTAGMKERGFSKQATEKLWSVLEPFADYAFNKSHSAAYGVVSYWTAYLKANYPAEYMAALLTSVKDDRDKLGGYLNECRRMGLRVLPPDVNASRAEFAPVGNDIRFGLTAIKNVGAGVVESIIATRERKGEYLSFVDFLNKSEVGILNKKLVESLIKAGAFDSLGHTRRGLVNVHVEAVDSMAIIKRDEAAGNASLFDDFDEPGADSDELTPGMKLDISTDEWEKAELLNQEREMLGLYVSDHPLLGVERLLQAAASTEVTAVFESEHGNGRELDLAGLITKVTRKTTKTGSLWATVEIEDLTGAVEVLFYPAAYQQWAASLSEDQIVALRVRVDRRDEDQPKLSGVKVTTLDLSTRARPLVITMPIHQCTNENMDKLRELLQQRPGDTEVHIKLVNGSRVTMIALEQPRIRVRLSDELYSDLKVLLGPGCV